MLSRTLRVAVECRGAVCEGGRVVTLPDLPARHYQWRHDVRRTQVVGDMFIRPPARRFAEHSRGPLSLWSWASSMRC